MLNAKTSKFFFKLTLTFFQVAIDFLIVDSLGDYNVILDHPRSTRAKATDTSPGRNPLHRLYLDRDPTATAVPIKLLTPIKLTPSPTNIPRLLLPLFLNLRTNIKVNLVTSLNLLLFITLILITLTRLIRTRKGKVMYSNVTLFC